MSVNHALTFDLPSYFSARLLCEGLREREGWAMGPGYMSYSTICALSPSRLEDNLLLCHAEALGAMVVTPSWQREMRLGGQIGTHGEP